MPNLALSRHAQRQALTDTRNTMGIISLLCFVMAGLTLMYLATYAMNANDPIYLARASAHAKALDLAVYRQCFWVCPVAVLGFVITALISWFANLELLSL